MKKNTIKQKLLIYNFILFFLSFIIALYTNWGSLRSWKNYTDFTNQYSQLNEFYKNIGEADSYAQSYLYSYTEEDLIQYRSLLDQCYDNLIILRDTTQNKELKWKYSRLSNMIDTYNEYFQELAVNKVKVQDKYEFFIRIGENIQRTYIEYSTMISNRMNETKTIMSEHLKKQILATFLIGFVILTITVVFGITATKSITEPIRKIVKNISKIKRGEYNLIPINAAKTAEVEILCNAIEEMAIEIQNSIQHVKDKNQLETQLLEKENENLKMNELLIETELKVLQGQMNPHFLFNTLSLISKMAYLEHADKTSELMETTSDLLRYSLNKSNCMSDLQGEISCVENYLKIQNMRFGHRIQFQLEVQEKLPKVIMPGMIIQPIIENAVIHGVQNITENAVVHISIKQKNNSVYILVEDNGVGMDSTRLEEVLSGIKENSIGIINVRKRLEMFYGIKQIMSIESALQCGTAITIILPVMNESEENYVLFDIIEDEPIERAALRLMIQTNCSFISKIEEAENGFLAIEKCKKNLPDIAVVDINMPGINGLDTIKELKKLNNKIRVIILSSYNQFEYAQTALKLGVEDFILKPAKITDLKKALENIREKINTDQESEQEKSALLTSVEEIRPIVEIDCIYGLVSGKTKEELDHFISFLGFTATNGFCFVISFERSPRYILRSVKNALEEVGLHCVGEQFHNYLVFFLLSNETMDERKRTEVGHFIRMLLDECGKKDSKIGIGNIYNFGSEIRDSYREALCAIDQCLEGEYLLYIDTKEGKNTDAKNYDDIIHKILNALKTGTEQDLFECIGEIFKIATVNTYSFKQLKGNVYQFIILCLTEIGKQYNHIENVDCTKIALEEFMALKDNHALEIYLKILFQSILENVADYQKDKFNLLVEKAKQYIEENYKNNILLEQVAEALTISPYYLSKILKKHTGKNFIDLISERRIEESKKLLRLNKSIKEVTFEVGFNSQNYFTKIFKKYEDCTPRDYREKYAIGRRV